MNNCEFEKACERQFIRGPSKETKLRGTESYQTRPNTILNWHLLFLQMTQKPPSKIKKYMLFTKINLISYTERIRTTLSSGSSYFGLLLLDCQISSPSISPSLHFRFHNSTVVTMSTFLHKCCRFSSALHNFRLVKFKKKKGVTYNFNFCI